MRTALYVYAPTTVTIRATAPLDANAQLYRYNQSFPQPAVGTHKLEPGIYMIVSKSGLEIQATNVGVATMGKDKDIVPEPNAQVIGLEPGATAASIQSFFELAKDASPDD